MKRQSHNRILTQEDDNRIAQLYLEGKTIPAIHKMYSDRVKQNKSICDSLKRSGIQTRKKHEYTKLRHDAFARISSEAAAYFLGWLISDGWVQANSNQLGLEIHKKDEYILEKIRAYTESETQFIRYKSMVRWCVNSPIMKRDLERYGVVAQKTFSTYLPYLALEWMPALLRGIIDGDGTVHFANTGAIHIKFAGNFELISGVRQFLTETLRGLTSPKVTPCNTIWTITWTDAVDVERLIEYIWPEPMTEYVLRRKNPYYMKIAQAIIPSRNLT